MTAVDPSTSLSPMKAASLALTLSLLSGCGAWWRSSPYEPFTPKVQQSDLVFARTGDQQYYYVLDKKRGLCFFHARLYGERHLATIECDKIPEFRELLGQNQPEAPVGTDAPAATEVPVEPAMAAETVEAVRRAWIQDFCTRRQQGGEGEPMEVLLARHGLDQATYDQVIGGLQADAAAWDALQKEADATCPETPPKDED